MREEKAKSNSSTLSGLCPHCGSHLDATSLWCSSCLFDLRTKSQLGYAAPPVKGLDRKQFTSARWRDDYGMVRKFRNYPMAILGALLCGVLLYLFDVTPIPPNNPAPFLFFLTIACIYHALVFRNLVSCDIGTWRRRKNIDAKLIAWAVFGFFLLEIPAYWWLKSREKKFLQNVPTVPDQTLS
jgi:hypothetical protein